MDTLGSIVRNAAQRAFFEAYMERLAELSVGTILGEIFKTFNFTPALEAVCSELKDLDTDELERDLQREVTENEYLIYSLYESKSEVEGFGEELENAHRHLISYCDPEDYYGSSLFQIENTSYTQFNISNIQETIADYVGELAGNAVARSLDGNRHTSDNELNEVWSNAIQNICGIECWDEPYDKICQVFEDLPLGILSDKSDFGDGDKDVDAFIADMLARFPKLFKLNANSVVTSRNGYELYKTRFFPNSEMPNHLVPLYHLKSSHEFYTRDWSNLPSNCRFCASYETYLLLREQEINIELEYVYLDSPGDYVMTDVENVLCISAQANAMRNDISDFMNVMLPDFLSEKIPAINSETLQASIQAPSSNLLYVLSDSGGTVELSSLSQLKSLDISKLSEHLHSVGNDDYDSEIGSMLDEYCVDEPRTVEDFKLVYGGYTKLEIPNTIHLASSSLQNSIIRTVYLDEYLGMTDNFRLDSRMLKYLAPMEENCKYLALDLADSECHAVLEAEISFERKHGRIDYAHVVTKATSNVSIVYYPSTRKSYLYDDDRNPIEHEDYVRWSVLNFSTLNNKLKGGLEFLYGTSTDAPCLQYFGYRGKKLYKNSNFMAYSYLYMFLPQIFGRFGEHVQSDTLSQTLPLGVLLNTYFKVFKRPNEPLTDDTLPENPRQFLQFARDYTLMGLNPLMPPTKDDFRIRGRDSDYPLFVGSYLRELSAESLETYNSPIRFLYSFIDTYTKPIAILYNALQFATGPRANPELRTSKQNLTSSYPLNYSDGSWVSTYISSLEESQGSRFVAASVLTESNVSQATISQELDRFMRSAQVKEYFEIRTMIDAFHHIFDYRNKGVVEFPKIDNFKYSICDLFSVIDPSVGKYYYSCRNNMRKEKESSLHPYLYPSSEFKPKTVFDSEGEIVMSAFSQQLTASITFLSRFTSFVIGTFITEDFENSRFFKLFLKGDSSESASVKNTADFRSLLEFPIVTKKLAKIVKNPKVSSAVGIGREMLPFTVSNLSKNVVPLDVMRYMLVNHFSDMYTYVPMSIDEGVSVPKGKRMSLGAYCSIYLCLAGSKKAFLGLQSAEQYGAAQAVFEEFEVSFGDENYDFSTHNFVVRQATASNDEYSDSEKLSLASDADISSRFSNLTSAYQICIGQTGMGYIEQAQRGELEVFTFFEGDTNISTLGFRFDGVGDNGAAQYSIADSNGGNNSACYRHSTEGSLFILNWLADIFLTYTLDENTLRRILDGDEFAYSPRIEFNLDYHDIVQVFRAFDTVGVEFDASTDVLALPVLAAVPRLARIFEEYTWDQVDTAIPKLTGLHSGNFFDVMFNVVTDDSTASQSSRVNVDEISEISVFKKAIFRKVD